MGKVGSSRKDPPPHSDNNAHHHHFFKVYMPSFSSHQLKISSTFVKKINGVVPQKVILRDPRGRLWNVETKKVEGAYYFENGWHGFVENNFLKLGEFLVFRYTGNSVFDVMILGNSGCDKEYNVDAHLSKDKPDTDMEESTSTRPVFEFQEEKKLNKKEEREIYEHKQVKEEEKGKGVREEQEQDLQEKRGQEEQEEDLVRGLTMHQKQELKVVEQQDEKRQNEKQGRGEEELVREAQGLEQTDQEQERRQGQEQEQEKNELGLEQDGEEQCRNGICNTKSSAEASSAAEKDMVSNEASASTDLAQPIKTSFVAIYNPWKPYYLHIPKRMITSNKIKLKPEMVLRDPSRKLWPVRICFQTDGRYAITKGWWTFWKGNNLTRDDKCILEFSHNKGRSRYSNVIDVNIVRATTPGRRI